jgi:N-acetylglucosaminyldiphosphoundecaprenol N-acetyl-beta-D-mannosaminyltransferase
MSTTGRRIGCLFGILAAAGVVVAGALLQRKRRSLPVATDRQEVLGIPVDPLPVDAVMARIAEFIASGEPHHIFTADASGIMRAQDDLLLRAIVRQADLITPDGAGVMLASELHGTRLPERVSGVDLVERIAALSADKGYRVYLFGAAEGVADAAAAALIDRHPGLQIAGTRHGFFSAGEEAAIVAAIVRAEPQVLFVALGIPKQEQFIRAHFAELGIPVMIGVGGSFDVISGRLQRAPRWMQRTGLEWLYRLAQEPKRLPRLAALPNFIVAVWKERKAK